jgi:MATE family multidrug resistance protein
MLALDMDPLLVAPAAGFVHRLLPGMFANIVFLVLTKYLQNQHVLAPMLVISAVANVFNFAANYLLIYVFGMGLNGAPVATSLCRAFQCGALCLYIARSTRHARCWPRRSVLRHATLRSVRSFAALGFAGGLMIALEAWAFDLSNVLAVRPD